MMARHVAGSAWQEIVDSVANWRLIHLIGSSELRRRFARSKLGQVWVTVSTAIFVIALSMFWTQVLKAQADKMVPYLAVGHILWLFLIGCILDSTTAFHGYAGYLQNQYLPNGVIILAIVYRHLLLLAYNSIVILAVMSYFGLPWWGIIEFLPLLAATAIIITCLSYVLAIFCVRFRDLIQVVNSVMSLMYFFTPILWKPQTLEGSFAWVMHVNPFGIIISVLRRPLLGEAQDATELSMFLGLFVVSVAIAAVFVGWLRHRIVFWI